MGRVLLFSAPTILFLLFLILLDPDHLRFVVASVSHRCPDGEMKEIESTVKTYNKILSDFYASGGNPALINSMPAAKQVKHEVFRDLGYVKRINKILVYDMASITTYRIRLTGPGRAEGQFYEEWNFLYQNADRAPITRPIGFGRGFRYHLKKEKGKWVVNDWDPDSTVPDLSAKDFKS